MKVLHLSASYPYNDLYRNLLCELDRKGIDQLMYVALKDKNKKNKRILSNAKSTSYIFSNPFNNLDRYIYYTKINKILKDLEKNVDVKSFNLIHAHFLFSDGGVAYKLKKKYGTNYIVAVRNTDINFFFKYALHVRNYGIKILKEASKIIFISPSYKEYLFNKYIPKKYIQHFRKKSHVIPNGLDNYWLENMYFERPKKQNFESLNIISVGDLNMNKNVLTSLKVIKLLKDKGYKVKFDIVGEGPLKKTISKLIGDLSLENDVKLHGYINNKDKLRDLYRKSDIYLMPSITETFGLVYIEAMSQGLPVIYSRNQGIDGFFKEGHIGFSVEPSCPELIVGKIEEIIKSINNMSINAINSVNEFNWFNIADLYIKFYQRIEP